MKEVVRAAWLPGLNEISGSPRRSTLQWLAGGSYQTVTASAGSDYSAIVRDKDEFLGALAFDINRMVCAAIESVASAVRIEQFPRSMSWLCVKAYYNAFYAAHALLRSTGTSFTQIDPLTASALNSAAGLYGVTLPKRITPGYFVCRVPADCTQVELVSLSGDRSHASMWIEFLQYVDHLRMVKPSMLSTLQQAQIDKSLKQLRANLCESGFNGGNYLSNFRNDVNYKHAFGVWFPYSNKIDHEAILDSFDKAFSVSWINIDLANSERLTRFINTCLFLMSMIRELIGELKLRNSDGDSFVKFGPLKMAAQMGWG